MISSLLQRHNRPIFHGSVVGFLLVAFSMAVNGPVGKNLFLFSGLYTSSFLLLGLLVKTFPEEWPAGKQLVFILCLAILCRFLFLAFPASFDVNRYVWEGYILNEGFNPYLYAPNDPVLKPLVNDIWMGINHKDASAAYPPLAMLVFRLAAWISPSLIFFKIVIMLFDLAAISVLALMVRSRGIQTSRLCLYALNPLVLIFIAGEGHMDALQVFFICLTLFSFTQKREKLGFFALGCAIMSKYFAIVLLPFLINRENWKKSFTLLIPFLSYLPFWDTGRHLFSSLVPFGTIMHYNDSLTVLLRDIFGPDAIWASVILLVTCLGIIFLLVHDPLRSSFLALGALLLLIGTLHPWYLTLITPFLVFFSSRAWGYLHFAVIFTFPVLHVECQTGVFQEIRWLKLFEYLPFYGMLIWDFITQRPFSRHGHFRPTKNFSVVIPTLDESEYISQALESLRGETGLLETIVVDGGSSDETQDKARKLGARVIEGKRGRGLQIHRGIGQCQGDIILILHADCRIRGGTLNRILTELSGNHHYVGGALGMRYSPKSFKNRFLAWLNNSRARWTGISFGDQGQFFRKESLALIGGYPDQMLMEDVELSLRLKENGSTCFIPHGVVVSQRRWEERGFLKNFKRVVTLCLSYLIQRRLRMGEEKRVDFYNRYYNESP